MSYHQWWGGAQIEALSHRPYNAVIVQLIASGIIRFLKEGFSAHTQGGEPDALTYFRSLFSSSAKSNSPSIGR